ncbi:MAG: serine/threonine protein kinase [bacterium]|nr:serine/threonine protein kinase [bacterium]
MRSSHNTDSMAVIVAFLQRFLADADTTGSRSLAEYQALYPGFEMLIETEFRRLHGELDPSPAPCEAAAADAPEDNESRASVYDRLHDRLARDVDPAVSIGAERAVVDVSPGRYSSLEELAQGGMGTIRRVWDRDLRRPLAMKMLRQRCGDGTDAADLISRFLEEAQITSQLAHPGIVPVHELGLTAAGNPYFTMTLVRGRNLKEIIDSTRGQRASRHIGRLLGILAKACDAVAYAHSEGVIHRDLKPSNVMVGKFGEVFVMDWGLARVSGTPDRHDIRLRTRPDDNSSIRSPRRDLAEHDPDGALVTMDGDVIGTPAYMAPEQARGEVNELGPRSDVYSLGAILYHMLTGRPPYARSADAMTTDSVLERVLAGPPAAVARNCTDVPPELAAICEKAMARAPEHRYRSALEFGNDLHAFLEGRVVEAYEAGSLAQARKWVQRNRGLAIASCTALTALIVGLVLSLVFMQQADDQAALAQRNATRAEASFETAFEAVRRMLTRVGLNTLVDVPQMDLARRELLQDALQLDRRLLEMRPDDPAVQREIALAHVRIGTNERRLGDYVAAELALQQGERDLARLATESPGDFAVVMATGLVRIELGNLAAARGNQTEAIGSIQDGLQRLASASSTHPDHPDLQALQADALGRLAACLHERDSEEDAEAATAAMRRAVAIRGRLANRDPSPLREREHASAMVMLATTLPHATAEKEPLLREARRQFERLLHRDSHDRHLRFALADACNRLGLQQKRKQQHEAAEHNFERAIEIRRTLARDWPLNPLYESELAGALSNYGDLLRINGSLPTARELLEEAIDHTQNAIAIEPERAGLRRYLYNQHHKLCRVLALQHDYHELAKRSKHFAAIPIGWRAYERVATFLTVASDLARQDAQADGRDTAAITDTWLTSAVAHLGLAVDRGFAEAAYFDDNDLYPDLGAWLAKKAELASLRGRPDFVALQARVQTILDQR